MRFLVLFCAILAPALAQVTETTGAIRGTVREAVTGAPIAGTQIILLGPTGTMQTGTPDAGTYRFFGLAPGVYQLRATDSIRGTVGVRSLVVAAGQQLDGIDFEAPQRPLLSGHLLDEDGKPVNDFVVRLMGEIYDSGELHYYLADTAAPNEKGEYVMRNALAGISYVLLACRKSASLDPISQEPADPEARKPTPVETWYPDSLSHETALRLTLRPGERREDLDIKVRRLPPRCLEGGLVDANGPASLEFSVFANALHGGAGGKVSPTPSKAPPDGRIRICGVPRVDFRLYAFRTVPGSIQLGWAVVPAGDKDVNGLRIAAMTGATLRGQVMLDGQTPAEPNARKQSLLITMSTAEGVGGASATSITIPGPFTFPNVEPGDHTVTVSLPKNLYVKDILATGMSVLHRPFRTPSDLLICIGRDGGSINAQVRDSEGKPVPDSWVVITPSSADTEAAVADAMTTSLADQFGNYQSPTLAPGKYLALAVNFPVDRRRERIARLFRARSKATEIEISPGAAVPVTIAPVVVD